MRALGGLFAGAATAAALTPDAKAEARDYAAWEAENYGKPGGRERHWHDEALTTLLPAFREVATAMTAVLDADLEVREGSLWLEDVASIRYFADLFSSQLESDALPNVESAAEAELARRLKAHERGTTTTARSSGAGAPSRGDRRRRG